MIVAFANQKGGVGKTSTVFHLAGALAEAGARVLVADLDPQASLSQAFLGSRMTADLDPASTLFGVLAGDRPSPEAITRRTDFDGIDLIPGSIHVADLNTPAGANAAGLKEVRACLGSAVGYHFTLIDCPPNIARCTVSALLAADLVVVPVQPEDFGAQGITAVEAAIGRARAMTNPGLGLAGYLVTMFDSRPALPRHYVDELRLSRGASVFDAMVPRSIDFAEAVMRRRPITLAKPRSKAAESMRAVASEFFRRTSTGLPGVIDAEASALALAEGRAV